MEYIAILHESDLPSIIHVFESDSDEEAVKITVAYMKDLKVGFGYDLRTTAIIAVNHRVSTPNT